MVGGLNEYFMLTVWRACLVVVGQREYCCALEPHAAEEVVVYEFLCGEQEKQLASSPSGSRLLAAPIHPKEENKDCP